MEKLIIAVAVLALVQCQSGNFSCFAPGFYCANDLSGYYQCSIIPGNGTLVQGIKNNCTVGKKCSCFINTKCTVPQSGICKVNPPPPTLSQDFDYTYFCDGVLTSPTSSIKTKMTKRFIRNANLRMLSFRGWNTKTLNQTFEVIIPSGNSFLTYSGRHPSAQVPGIHFCNKKVTTSFPSFWPDLNLFVLMKTVCTSATCIQTWECRIGNRTANETASGEIIDLELKSGLVTPLRHVIYRNPSAIVNTAFTETRQLFSYFQIKQPAVFFRVPGFCPPAYG